MPPRAYWSGNLRLSLVTVPVRLHTATTGAGKVQLHQIHRATGERVRYQNVVPDHGPVERDDIVKGYEYEKGHYVTFENEELEKIRAESRHTINIVQFVELNEIDPLYYDRPYFVVPDGEVAEEAYLVVREALCRARKAALGHITLGGKEHITTIRPCGRGMLLETLRYADEVKRANQFFDTIEERDVDDEQLSLAEQLVKTKSAPFRPEEFHDRHQIALRELIEAKIQHRRPKSPGARDEGGKVINLMDALKRSVAEGGSRRTSATKTPAKTSASGSSKSGKSSAKAKSKKTNGSPARRKKSA